MNPFHTPEEFQFLSNLGHWIEGGILGAVAIIALLEALGYLKFAWGKYLWPGLVLFAGIFLLIFLAPLHHGLNYAAIKLNWDYLIYDPQQRQHLIMAVLLTLGGLAEVSYRRQPDGHSYLQLVWPIILAAIGLMFILHPQHGTSEAIAKAHQFHQYLGFVLIVAGVLRRSELKRPETKWLAFGWIIFLAIASVMLISYREPEGAYMPNLPTETQEHHMQ